MRDQYEVHSGADREDPEDNDNDDAATLLLSVHQIKSRTIVAVVATRLEWIIMGCP
jgi:hypothetical protein